MAVAGTAKPTTDEDNQECFILVLTQVVWLISLATTKRKEHALVSHDEEYMLKLIDRINVNGLIIVGVRYLYDDCYSIFRNSLFKPQPQTILLYICFILEVSQHFIDLEVFASPLINLIIYWSQTIMFYRSLARSLRELDGVSIQTFQSLHMISQLVVSLLFYAETTELPGSFLAKGEALYLVAVLAFLVKLMGLWFGMEIFLESYDEYFKIELGFPSGFPLGWRLVGLLISSQCERLVR